MVALILAAVLAAEPSPYLKAHAGDKVAWRPWGPEAFAQARRQDKPVFLSIGYLACHWCHRMQVESFSDAAIAKVLNESFVPVLVDREELPEVDQLYSTGAALPVRVLEDRDAEVPSATSAAALNRLRLALYGGPDGWPRRSERTLAVLSGRLKSDPRGLAKLACAAELSAAPPLRVVVTEGEGAEALLREVRGRYLPRQALLVLDAEGRKAFVERFAFLRGAVPVKGRAAAYVCRRQSCELPATSPVDLAALLDAAVR